MQQLVTKDLVFIALTLIVLVMITGHISSWISQRHVPAPISGSAVNDTDTGKKLVSFLKDPVRVKDWILAWTKVVFVTLLFGILVGWLLKPEGTVILPFDSAGDDYSGKALADSLATELQEIRRIHESPPSGIQPESLALKKLQVGTENTTLLAEVDAIDVGDFNIPVKSLLISLKKLLPLQSQTTITGSIQKYGKKIRVVARHEYRDNVRTWEVSTVTQGDDETEVTNLIHDLAYKMALGLSGDDMADGKPKTRDADHVSAKTWQGFKHFSEALDSYDTYLQTGRIVDLNRAAALCIRAANNEHSYYRLYSLYYNLGVAYYNRHSNAQAERLFRCAIAVAPNSLKNKAKACIGLASSLRRAGGHDTEALETYENALKCTKEAEVSLIKSHELSKDKSDELNRQFAECYYGIGVIIMDKGQTNKAIDLYKKGLDVAPQRVMIRVRLHNALGVAYYDTGYLLKENYTHAKTHFDKAIAENLDIPKVKDRWPRHSYIPDNIGEIYLQQNRFDEAHDQFKKAIINVSRQKDQDYQPFLHLGLVMALKPDTESQREAQRNWRISLKNWEGDAASDRIELALLQVALAKTNRERVRATSTLKTILRQIPVPASMLRNSLMHARLLERAKIKGSGELVKILQKDLDKKQPPVDKKNPPKLVLAKA